MSNPQWSAMADPPVLLLRGYSAQGKSTVLRTDMDAGAAKVRQRYTAVPQPVTGTVICSEAQYAELVTFLDTSCAGGALRFDWTDPHDASTVEMRYVPPWSETPLGLGNWEIALSLEIMP